MCLLTLAVSLPMLRPPPCSQGIEDNDCQKASSLQIGIFFFALYIIAAGTGGLSPTSPHLEPTNLMSLSLKRGPKNFPFSIGGCSAL
ncbi:putative proton-dependent oligopeptide transporter family [Medicago truncatula]|uniref:Putative proton-dependent oligopeptide transporter family n=1 Tax=Medicago truncatula TaxID=3880 RepID=A0A396HBE2_MEDTR|nr:putative proton-dependent oligopeptide transporter family [Medicago truncatula]